MDGGYIFAGFCWCRVNLMRCSVLVLLRKMSPSAQYCVWCARHKLQPVPSNEGRLNRKAGRGFPLHLNLLRMTYNKNVSHCRGRHLSSVSLWFPAACIPGGSELYFCLVCMDFMHLHPNGTIKIKTPSKQPQVRFLYEAQMKQPWSCRWTEADAQPSRLTSLISWVLLA